MPRFFFHVHASGGREFDLESRELANEFAAREAAREAARDLVSAAVREGRFALDDRIVVEDERARTVQSITLGEALGDPGTNN